MARLTLTSEFVSVVRSRTNRFVVVSRPAPGPGVESGGSAVRSVAVLPKTSDRLFGLNARSEIGPFSSLIELLDALPLVEMLASVVVPAARSLT